MHVWQGATAGYDARFYSFPWDGAASRLAGLILVGGDDGVGPGRPGVVAGRPVTAG